MKKNLPIEFKYSSRSIRTFKINFQPWFVVKDVCDILEIKNTSQVVQNLDEDEKLTYVLHISGQNRETLIINESGLYALILRSNKPEAKKFRKWVTNEVIPSIMRRGYYQAVLTDRENIEKVESLKKEVAILIDRLSFTEERLTNAYFIIESSLKSNRNWFEIVQGLKDSYDIRNKLFDKLRN